MTLCSSAHPEQPDVLCDKGSPCFGFHANSRAELTWPGNPLPPIPAKTRKTGRGALKAQLALMAQRANQ